MNNLTFKVRKLFLNNETVSVSDLYDNFIDYELLDVSKQKHKIRSVVNTLVQRNEIIRISSGLYKISKNVKTSENVKTSKNVQVRKNSEDSYTKNYLSSDSKVSFLDPAFD